MRFLGRISPEKSVDRAIRIAERCGLPIKIAAKIDKVDRDYFDEQIRPLMSLPFVDYVGEIDDARKSEFLSGAIALLVPIDWPEPFGLVMIEAMACGTPVIAFNRGSVPESHRGRVDRLHRRGRNQRGRRDRPVVDAVARNGTGALRRTVYGPTYGQRLSRGLSQSVEVAVPRLRVASV